MELVNKDITYVENKMVNVNVFDLIVLVGNSNKVKLDIYLIFIEIVNLNWIGVVAHVTEAILNLRKIVTHDVVDGIAIAKIVIFFLASTNVDNVS